MNEIQYVIWNLDELKYWSDTMEGRLLFHTDIYEAIKYTTKEQLLEDYFSIADKTELYQPFNIVEVMTYG